MPETKSDGITIRYVDEGAGDPALLLLPGWCGSRAVFDGLIPLLRSCNRTIALDWRGHGESGPAGPGLQTDHLVRDAIAVIEASGAREIVPVAVSHAAWIAIELRRRLGARVSRMVLLDALVLEPPPDVVELLERILDPAQFAEARRALFAMWVDDASPSAVLRYVYDDMASYDQNLWATAASEILARYAREKSPLRALDSLRPHVPVAHLFARPDDQAYLDAQVAFAGAHSWFHVRKLVARSQFPALEVPEQVAHPITKFVGAKLVV